MITVYSVCRAWDERTVAYFETLAALVDRYSDFHLILCDASDNADCAVAIRGALPGLRVRSWRFVRSRNGDTPVDELIVLRQTCATDSALWWPTALGVSVDDILVALNEPAHPPSDTLDGWETLALVDVAQLRTQPTRMRDAETTHAAVSVIVTSHNYGRYLRQALQSVYDQTLAPTEVIVIDDDSSDDTADVAREFAERGATYVRGTWRSAARSRNEGAARSSSPLLLFLDADDYLDSRYLEITTPHFDDPEIGIVYGNWQFTGLEDRLFDAPEFDRALLRYTGYIKTDAVFRREALRQVHGFRSDIFFEDWDLAKRISAAGWSAQKAPGAKTFYRYHSAGRIVTYNRGRTRAYAAEAEIAKNNLTIYTAIDAAHWNARSYLEAIEHLGVDPQFLTLHWIDISAEPSKGLASLLATFPAASVQYTSATNSGDASPPADPMATALSAATQDRGDAFAFVLAAGVDVRPRAFMEVCDRLESHTAAIVVRNEATGSAPAAILVRSALLAFIPPEKVERIDDCIEHLRTLSAVAEMPDDVISGIEITPSDNLDPSLAANLWHDATPIAAAVPPRCLAIISYSGPHADNLARCLAAVRFGAHGVALSTTIVVPKHIGETTHIREIAGDARIASSAHAALDSRTSEQFVLFLDDNCYLQRYDDLMNLITTLRSDRLASVRPHANPNKQRCELWDVRWIDRFGPLGRMLKYIGARRGRNDRVALAE